MTTPEPARIVFIGGGNMASAIIGGLVGRDPQSRAHITAIDPSETARSALQSQWGIATAATAAQAAHAIQGAQAVVWAVKPQVMREVAASVRPLLPAPATGLLHISVAAGIPADSLAAWLGTPRIVRAMPNTPALVGRGMTGLFARAEVDAPARALTEHIIAPTGQWLWVAEESLMDAVIAVSGSGPAYVFLLLEAMTRAGTEMGLSAAQALHLACATFAGAAELAQRSGESPALLRERVTSRGGTTHAAITHMQNTAIAEHFVRAMHAAHQRAAEIAAEFGREGHKI